jgi:hypothetical protein
MRGASRDINPFLGGLGLARVGGADRLRLSIVPFRKTFVICCLHWVLAFLFLPYALSQTPVSKSSTRDTADLRIEVRGGEKSVPVKNASVYVEYRQDRFLRGKKKYRYGVKTNNEGVALLREVPKGKILIQVVAEGWKPFGKVYQIETDETTVEIVLQRPQKWY